MLEAKFFRDYKHSYMILPCKSRQPEKVTSADSSLPIK